ncbi:MAG: S1C family serine protease [Faecousia sp.]
MEPYDRNEEELLPLEPEDTEAEEIQPVEEEAFEEETEPMGNVEKSSPFSDSPYERVTVSHQSANKPRKEKKPGRVLKTLTAAVLTVAVAAGSCAVTAALLEHKWAERLSSAEAAHEVQTAALEQKISDLENEVTKNSPAASGISVSGSPAAVEGGLTPSQVYAKNVASVVAISNQATVNYYGQISETASSGSGFILSADGYVVSNYHVVQGATTLTVMTMDGSEYDAVLVGYDEANDISVLKIDATGLTPVTLGSSDSLIVGDQVVAIGNPLGELTSTLTVGYVSAKDRVINTDGTYINMMQTDAAINPGNSGGPLFNMKGEVVGITTAKYSGSTNSGASIEGIGFAIPIDDVRGMFDDLMQFGYIRNQPYLGVVVRSMDATTASTYGLPMGSLVDQVSAGSCAEKAGLKAKDIITDLGGYRITGNADLITSLRKFKAGDTTTITVCRAGQTLVLNITLDEKPHTSTTTPQEQQPGTGEMPDSGSYEDWFNYFFGGGKG